MDLQPRHITRNPDQYIGNRIAKAAALSQPISHYLDVVCGTTQYLETQAVNLCIAIEGYHRNAYPDAETGNAEHEKRLQDIFTYVPTQHKKWLKEQLRYSHEPSLRRRFKDVMAGYPDSVQWLIGTKRDRERFIEWAMKRRNMYSHGVLSKQGDRPIYSPSSEYMKIQFLRGILLMCFLSELGFSSDEIDQILHKNEHFAQLVSRRVEPGDPKIIHVRGKRGNWFVYAQGAWMRHGFKSKGKAIKKGRTMAWERSGTLVVHRVDGSIQNERSYRSESRNTQGKR